MQGLPSAVCDSRRANQRSYCSFPYGSWVSFADNFHYGIVIYISQGSLLCILCIFYILHVIILFLLHTQDYNADTVVLIYIVSCYFSSFRGKTSKRARDLHLLKTLKSHLRNNNEEEVLKTVSEIKTSGVRKQAVQALILSQHLTSSLLQGLLDIFLPVYCPGTEEEKGERVWLSIQKVSLRKGNK